VAGGVVAAAQDLVVGVNFSPPTETTDMFPFMSVALYLSTPAQIQHSAGLVFLQHHSITAISCQLLTAVNITSINMFISLQVPVEGFTLT
jgi:hypothetical protein